MKGELRAFSELGSSHQDGSFYFFSADRHFIIETIRADQYLFFKALLRDYHEYVKQNPRSLLPRILSFNKICIEYPQPHAQPGTNRIHFLVRSNILKSRPDFKQLATLPAALESGSPNPYSSFRSEKVVISRQEKDHLMEILKEDCSFLEKHKLTGYYLTVGSKAIEANDKLEDSAQSVDWAGIKRENNTAQGLTIPSISGNRLFVVGMAEILKRDE